MIKLNIKTEITSACSVYNISTHKKRLDFHKEQCINININGVQKVEMPEKGSY